MVFAKSATLRTFGEEFFFPFIKKETIQIVFGVKNFDFTTSVFFWTLYLTSGRYDFTGEVFSMHAVNGLWWCFFFVTFFFFCILLKSCQKISDLLHPINHLYTRGSLYPGTYMPKWFCEFRPRNTHFYWRFPRRPLKTIFFSSVARYRIF